MHKLTPVVIILFILATLFGLVDQVLADSTVIISPAAMGDWSFRQFSPSGSGEITEGPGIPPQGSGSARLSVNANGGIALASAGYPTTRLDAITRIQYSSYRASSDPGNNLTISLQLEMDYDLTDATSNFQGWLIYEPYRTSGVSGTVLEDTWYSWDALSGEWYGTRAPGSTFCPQSNPCTIAELLAIFPDAGVRHNGGVRLVAGDFWGLAFEGYVDALTIGVNETNTTHDFEDNDPPASVSAGGPYTGDEGQPVSISGSGSDPEGDPLTYSWSYTPGLEVDPGTACSFTDPSAPSSTVTCTDAGSFTLTLTVDDGINPPVSQSTTLTLSEANPSVSITSPDDGSSFRQGEQADVSAEVDDAGNDSLICTVDWGDGTNSTGVILDGICTASHTYGEPGDYTITVTVTDDDGGSSSHTANVTVFNDPPTADAGGPYTGDEGQMVNISGLASDPEDDPLTYTWSYTPGPGVDSGTSCLFGDSTSLSTTFTCTDNGLFDLTLTIEEGFNSPVSDSTTVFLGNLEPTLNITSPQDGDTFRQSEIVDASARVREAGENDILSCTVDWEDGFSSEGTITNDDCTASHAYTTPGEYTITITIADDDGGNNSQTVSITVFNDPPSVDAGGPYNGSEGQTIYLSGSAVDLEGDALAVAWTFSPSVEVATGTTCIFEDSSSTNTSLSCTDNGSFTLTLTVDDGINPPVTGTATLTLANIAPQVNVTSPADSSVFVISETVNMAATFMDDGINDTHLCQVTWGDGTTVDGAIIGSVCSASHAYTASGDYSITATVQDDDNASASDSVTITINTAPNSPPVTDTGGPYTGDEGQAINLAGSATDSDGDTLTVAWTYTPGAGVDLGTTCTFGNPTAPATSFFCTDDGQFSLTMTADDGHNPPVEDTASITINNLPPVVSLDALIGNPIFQVGAEVPLTASITDPSIHDTHICQVNWDDGTITAGVVSNGACTASHAFSDQGEYTLTMTVIDDDGGSGSDSVSVTVSDELSPIPMIYLPLMTQNWSSNR